MKFLRFDTPGIAHHSYLLAEGAEAAVVDPRRDVAAYLDAARRLGVNIRYVIETHRQEDFVLGSAHLAGLTGAQVVNGTHECFGRGDLRLDDGETFALGRLRIQALHTPGHTPESMCWAIYPKETPDNAWGVFTGDTLFFGATGRSDLPDPARAEHHAGRLWDSVHRKLGRLNDSALIFPAHGPGSVCGSGMAPRPFSTIGLERGYNPVFRQDRYRFAREKGAESRLMPRPPYFRYMEEVNMRGGLPPAPPAAAIPLLAPEDFGEAAREGCLIDTREPEGFAGAHIPHAYSIWLGGLPVFAGWIAAPESPLFLCLERESDLDSAWLHLTRTGHDRLKGVLAGGFPAWRNASQEMRRSGTATPGELGGIEGLQVLDVRDEGEFAGGHIAGARHCYVGHLEEHWEGLGLDPARPVVVTCSVGHRAGLGVSILLRQGFGDVRNLLGGMTRWKALGLPVEKGRG